MAYHDITDFIIQHGPSTQYQYLAGDPVIEIHDSDRSGYGFVQSAYGGTYYLASSNRGLGSTVATMKLTVRFTGYPITDDVSTAAGINLRITYISNGEDNYDYALFSKSGLTDFSTSATYDDSDVYKSAYGESSTVEQTLDYYIPNNGDQTNIFINYRKDSSVNYGLDRLYMRIAFEILEEDPNTEGYYFVGRKIHFHGYRFNYNRDIYDLSTGVGKYITSGWPELQSGLQMNEMGRGIVFVWSSGYSETPPADVGEDSKLRITVEADKHRSATTWATVTVIKGDAASDVRIDPSELYFYHVYLQQLLWKFVMWAGTAPEQKLRWSQVVFTVSDNNGNEISGKTDFYGRTTILSSALTSSISDKTITWSRPGGLPSSTSTEWLPSVSNVYDPNYLYCLYLLEPVNTAVSYLTSPGLAFAVHMAPPENKGQIATQTFIHNNIMSAFTVSGVNKVIRWAENQLFAYDFNGNYPLTDNNELICMPYIMNFSGKSISYGYYADGGTDDLRSVISVWNGDSSDS